ncbi:MAG: FkbM family methyltransferase [Rhodospirillaceae bacterium]|nr:FkbM family methyltransferase [Rhodospirillaceae bacterium]
MNDTYRVGWAGRRLFGRMRTLERLIWSHPEDVLDVYRFGLRWRLYHRSNVADSRLLLRPNSFETKEINSILDVLHPSFVFIDVGANCGFFSLRVSSALPQVHSGRVIALEPHPEMRRRLSFNVELNSASDISIQASAVSDRTGSARLLEGVGNLGESRVSDRGSIDVELRTLLDVVSDEGLKRIDAIKVDVEGHEDRVLGPFFQDAPNSLLPRVLVAEYRWGDSWKIDWMASATKRGYVEKTRTRFGNIILIRP